MSTNESRELVQLLLDIESRSHTRVIDLPGQDEPHHYWEGIVFSLMNARLVAPLDEVVEILYIPPVITMVPGTRTWMRGLANIRGNLLPIIDLRSFLGSNPIQPGRRNRILVINHQGTFAGLLVEEIIGMRHFLHEQHVDLPPPSDLPEEYVQTVFEQDGETWPVFSMRALAESPEFRVAAL